MGISPLCRRENIRRTIPSNEASRLPVFTSPASFGELMFVWGGPMTKSLFAACCTTVLFVPSMALANCPPYCTRPSPPPVERPAPTVHIQQQSSRPSEAPTTHVLQQQRPTYQPPRPTYT